MIGGTDVRNLEAKTEPLRGKHSMVLWPGEFKNYILEVFLDGYGSIDAAFYTTSYAHARRMALQEFGPDCEVPDKEYRE
jgi:hypothetical protein